MKSPSLTTQLEAILFVAGQPLGLKQLAAATGQPAPEVEQALKELKQQLSGRGINLTVSHQQYSLVSAPAVSEIVTAWLGQQVRAELSRPALETLAIVAYRQPITKTEIDRLRGVSSEQTIKNLLLRDLIQELGQSKLPGRPWLYGTTSKFLHYLGLSDLADLPPVESLKS